MVSGIQAFSRRHVQGGRDKGPDTYYKSSRGPSAKEMSVAKNEGRSLARKKGREKREKRKEG